MTDTRLTSEQIADLRAKAEAATPGPWHWINSVNDEPRQDGEYRSSLRTVEQFPTGMSKTYPEHTLPKFILEAEDLEQDADAAYIAAANPSTILGLLDDRDRMAAEIARLRAEAEWRDISTAPDEDEFEIWIPSTSLPWPASSSGGNVYSNAHGKVNDPSDKWSPVATHWRPLPQPPEAS